MKALSTSVRALIEEYICDIVIFLYKIGEALLDASIRPFISEAVCNDMLFSNFGLHGGSNNHHQHHLNDQDYGMELLIVKDFYRLRFRGGVSTVPYGGSNLSVVCSDIEQVADDVQREVAGVLVMYRLLVSVPAVILGLFCGAWSDSRGCKLPMMAPSAGSCLAVVFYILSVHVPRAKVALLLTGAAMQGVFGKTSMITMAVNSQVSHTSDSEQRTRRLGRLLASNYLGMFLGALLAGFLQDVSTLTTTLTCVSLCHALCVFAVLLGVTEVVAAAVSEHAESEGSVVAKSAGPCPNEQGTGSEISNDGHGFGGGEGGGGREGYSDEGRGGGERKKKEHGLFSWGGLKDSLMAAVRKREGDKRAIILICLVVLTVTQILKVGDQDVTVLFVEHPPLSWPSYLYGYLIAADSGVMGLTLLLLLPVLSDILAVSDTHLVFLGVTFKLARALWAGFCTRTWMMFTSVVLGAVGGVINPGLRSVLSKTADRGEVGKLFSIQASLETLAKLVGSGIFTGIYAATVDLYPPIAYLAEVVVYLVMAAVLLWLGRLLKEPETYGLLLTVSKARCSKTKDGTLVGSVVIAASGASSSSVLSSSSSMSESLPLTGKKGGGETGNALGESVFAFGGASTP